MGFATNVMTKWRLRNIFICNVIIYGIFWNLFLYSVNIFNILPVLNCILMATIIPIVLPAMFCFLILYSRNEDRFMSKCHTLEAKVKATEDITELKRLNNEELNGLIKINGGGAFNNNKLRYIRNLIESKLEKKDIMC